MVYRTLRKMRARLRPWIRPAQVERDLDAELGAYVDELTARGRAAGLDEREARAAALREAGSLVRVKEACRDHWSTRARDEWAADLRQALRTCRRAPAFTAVAVVTLAIGVGASTAIFGQVNAVFLAPLPVARPHELRLIDWTASPAGAPRRYTVTNRFSYSAFRLLQDHATGFAGLACWSGAFVNFGSEDRLETHVVSGGYFDLLGVRAAAGRLIVPDDERRGAAVAVISDALWQRAFGGDASAVGRTVAVNGERVEIVGVLPRNFVGLNPARAADLYLPLSMYSTARYEASTPRRLENDQDWSACELVARMAPGVADEAARAQAEQIAAQAPFALERRTGPTAAGPGAGADAQERRHVRLAPAVRGTDDLRVQTSQSLVFLMAATILLLLIACANVAGLLLARAPARAHEVGTRLALGASRGRIVRQLIVEGLLLALAGGAAGTFVAWQLNELVPGLLGSFVSNGADVARVQPATDVRVLAFAFAASLITGVAFGVAPAIVSTRVDLLEVTKRLSPSRRASRRLPGKVLVGAQVGLALVLLIGAGLLVRTVDNLRSLGPSGLYDRQLHFSMSPGQSGYREARLRRLVEDAVTQVAAAPGVVAGSAVGATGLCIAAGGRNQTITANAIAPGLFEAAGTALLAGRDFTWDDREGRPLVAMVNETFAMTYYGGRDVVGRTIEFCRNLPLRVIVGLVADTRTSADRSVRPLAYIPFVQPPPTPAGNIIAFTVRTDGDPVPMIPAVRRIASGVAPSVPLFDVETGRARRDRELVRQRLMSGFAAVYGLAALFMACLGLYGVMTYAVSRRTADVGVRMALGAQRGEVIAMVLRESLAPVAAGIAAGLAAAFVLTRWLEALLFGVSRTDPATMAAAVALLTATAVAAAWLPARRAARIDPILALRVE